MLIPKSESFRWIGVTEVVDVGTVNVDSGFTVVSASDIVTSPSSLTITSVAGRR